MNDYEFARENHKRWQEVEELATILSHMDDLLMRMMGDVKEIAAEGNYKMAMHGLEHDVGRVMDTVYDLHIRVQLLCSEANDAADGFETECSKRMDQVPNMAGQAGGVLV